MLLTIWGMLMAGSGAAQTVDSKPIHLHIFLSSGCPHCDIIQPDALNRYAKEHGCIIQPHYHNVDDMAEYKRLVAMEERMGNVGNDLPVVFVASEVLGGVKEIEEHLPRLLDELRLRGAPEMVLPTDEEAAAALVQNAPTDEAPLLEMVYFEEPGCRECARAERVLRLAETRFPTLHVTRRGASGDEAQAELEALGHRAGLPEAKRLLSPALFLGNRALVGTEITDAAVTELCKSFQATEPSALAISPEERAQAKDRLWQRARAVSIAAVIAGGLVDGVNPCAFATLVFFICCLSSLGKSKSSLLFAGGGFGLGVFTIYFLTGFGLSEALLGLRFLPALSRIVGWAIIAVTFIFAAVSLWDFIAAARGRLKDVKLRLPDRLRQRINAKISRNLSRSAIFPAALGLGATVSAFEFVCTGQIYLPLIRYMTSVSHGRMRGIGLLVLYNLAFLLPLAVVFAAVYFGVRSERLSAFFVRRVPEAKLLMAIFFSLLGGLLLHLQLKSALI